MHDPWLLVEGTRLASENSAPDSDVLDVSLGDLVRVRLQYGEVGFHASADAADLVFDAKDEDAFVADRLGPILLTEFVHVLDLGRHDGAKGSKLLHLFGVR